LTCLKDLAFYYAVGFAVLGFVILVALSSTLVGVMLSGVDPYAFTALAAAMFLPFVIGALSWRDWKEMQKKQTQEFAQKPRTHTSAHVQTRCIISTS
jgi:hypothetical protein